ncbi:MAG: CotH kinase family protein [Flavobacteriales bacterium]|nr:CotH kinase family protein [Flavobacteriales bacterium]
MPADVASIRAKYLEILAHELGLVTPEISFVRVIACGRDLGIHLKEERIDADFLEKQGLAGASLFEQGHDPRVRINLFPRIRG